MSNKEQRITTNPDVCNGKPTIRDKRITVETILDFLANGDQVEDVLDYFPKLESEDILACQQFASNLK